MSSKRIRESKNEVMERANRMLYSLTVIFHHQKELERKIVRLENQVIRLKEKILWLRAKGTLKENERRKRIFS